MRGMILAAGRGARMGKLTEQLPKPLLTVADHYLIEYALLNLKRAGIHEIVINLSYQGDKIKEALGDGSRYGVAIAYSQEPSPPLEVGGGLRLALPLLGDQPFVVISADVLTDFPLATLPREPRGLAHLVVVDNPPFHPEGDVGLIEGWITLSATHTFNYAGLGVYRPEALLALTALRFSWRDFMLPLITRQQVTGEYYQGLWYNLGTPTDLAEADKQLRECCDHNVILHGF